MKNNFLWAALCIGMMVCFSYAARPLVFIGLSGENAPAFEKNFELLLREQILSMPDLYSIEDFQLKKLRDRMPTLDYPTVSKSLIATVSQFAPDTVLLVWGRIKSYAIHPVRKDLIRAVAQGDLTLELFVYSITQQNYLFFGDVVASVQKDKGFIFFGNVETAIMVTTSDRSELIDKLELKATAEAGRLILSVVQSEQSIRRNANVSAVSKKRVTIVDDSPISQPSSLDEENNDSGGDDEESEAVTKGSSGSDDEPKKSPEMKIEDPNSLFE